VYKDGRALLRSVKGGALKNVTINRRGSLIYANGYRRLVVAAEIVYALLGAGLSVLAIAVFGTLIAGVILFSLVLLFVLSVAGAYRAILWFFRREARQSIEITDEGILELFDQRQRSFIPWEGVAEIELDATVVAGATLRIKGSFSEISISNLDLVITVPKPIREMNALLGQGGPMKELLADVRRHAPHASLKMNRLAERRFKETAV
jgi:hypothetical protein